MGRYCGVDGSRDNLEPGPVVQLAPDLWSIGIDTAGVASHFESLTGHALCSQQCQ